jgi:hypothetical protein
VSITEAEKREFWKALHANAGTIRSIVQDYADHWYQDGNAIRMKKCTTRADFMQTRADTMKVWDKLLDDSLDVQQLCNMMNNAWANAPDRRSVYDIPGFSQMCAILDGSIFQHLKKDERSQ